MQYAVLLYADVSPDAGPGDPDWDASAEAHQAFNDRIGELGLEGRLRAVDRRATPRVGLFTLPPRLPSPPPSSPL